MSKDSLKAKDIKSFWIEQKQVDSEKGLSVRVNGTRYILGGDYSEAIIRHLSEKLDNIENKLEEALTILEN